ncbi:MAG: amidohydrolase family protein [Gemmatimonadota bacterium]
MRNRIAAVALFTCILPAGIPPADLAAQESGPVAIVGATVIDGTGAAPMSDATILISGGRITAIGPRSQVDVPLGAQTVDGTGKYVVPGFIDANVHMSLYGAGESFVRYEQQNVDLTLESAQLHLKHGITTVRDSYGSLLALVEVRDRIARGEVDGPRILAAGNIVGWGGPYSISFALTRQSGLSLFQEQINDFITQGSGEDLMEMTPAELRVAINRYLDKGPDFIKFGGTSHFSDPVMIGFSPAAQQVMVEEAHKRGLVAETHSTSSEGLRLSLEAGVDLVQHPEILPGEMSDEMVRMFVDRGVICSMLSNTITGEPWERHLKRLEDRSESEDTATVVQRKKTSVELREERDAAGHGMQVRRTNAEKLIRAGCITTIGTDNYLGSAPEFRREPKALNQEMGIGSIIAIEGLVELGMTPMQALVAATRNGALATKGIADYGTLEVGKLADLLVLDADPLADISNIRKLSVVMKRGEVIDRDALPIKPVWHGR